MAVSYFSVVLAPLEVSSSEYCIVGKLAWYKILSCSEKKKESYKKADFIQSKRETWVFLL